MPLLAEKSISIHRAAPLVFDYATNMERFGEWFPGVRSIRSSNALAHGLPGKEYVETVVIPLRGRRQIKLTVREAKRALLFVTEGKLPPLMPRMEISFRETAENACTVTWRMYSRNDSLLVRMTLLPLARRVIARRADIGLARLKHLLENAPQAVNTPEYTQP